MVRVMPGGGSAPTGNTYTVKTEAVAPCNVSGYSAAAIKGMLSQLDPSAVHQAGHLHTEASATLHKVADNLADYAGVLADSWQGQAAQAAAGNFKQLHTTAIGLAQSSTQTGAVLTWLGGAILPWYQRWSPPQESLAGQLEQLAGMHPQDKAAQQILQRLNNRLVQANSGLPPVIHESLPGSTTWGKAYTGGQAGPAIGGAGGGGSVGSGATGAAAVGGSGGTPGFSGGPAGLGSGSGSLGGLGTGVSARPAVAHLAGYSPPGGTGAASSGGPGAGAGSAGSSGAGGGPGLLPVTGGVPGAGGSGGLPGDSAVGGPGGEAGLPGAEPPAGTALGPDAVLGPDGMISGVPGDPAAGVPGMTNAGAGGLGGEAGAGNAAAGTGADMAGQADGLGMMPMMGGGAGQRERERYRQSWLPEDADLWEGGAGPVPPVIGG